MSIRVLHFGTSGQVGHELTRLAISNARPDVQPDVEIVGASRKNADLTNVQQVTDQLNRHKPDVVINAAAYTAVDAAETEDALAYAVNADGPAHLARACHDRGIPLIHLSTDYVFDGTLDRPYLETDEVSPVNVYGASKLAGEQQVAALCPRHLILRTSWVFSAGGSNFVKTMLRIGKKGADLNIVDNQHGGPTAAADIAATCIKLAVKIAQDPEGAAYGTYHYSGAPDTNWHGFATEIFSQVQNQFGQSGPTLHAIAASQYPTPAVRPSNSRLDCEKLSTAFGISRPLWTTALAQVLEELHQGN